MTSWEKKKDRVRSRDGGWFAVVAGVEYGPWRSKAEALGGLAVEQRRKNRCSYPACKCIVTTSTTAPEHKCPQGLTS